MTRKLSREPSVGDPQARDDLPLWLLQDMDEAERYLHPAPLSKPPALQPSGHPLLDRVKARWSRLRHRRHVAMPTAD